MFCWSKSLRTAMSALATHGRDNCIRHRVTKTTLDVCIPQTAISRSGRAGSMAPSLHSERRWAATVDHCSKSSFHLDKDRVLRATKYFLAFESVFDDISAFQVRAEVLTVAIQTIPNFFGWLAWLQLNAIGVHEKTSLTSLPKKY